MLLSQQGGGEKYRMGGGAKMEQLLAKIKGGNYVSRCEKYGAFVQK